MPVSKVILPKVLRVVQVAHKKSSLTFEILLACNYHDVECNFVVQKSHSRGAK